MLDPIPSTVKLPIFFLSLDTNHQMFSTYHLFYLRFRPPPRMLDVAHAFLEQLYWWGGEEDRIGPIVSKLCCLYCKEVQIAGCV